MAFTSPKNFRVRDRAIAVCHVGAAPSAKSKAFLDGMHNAPIRHMRTATLQAILMTAIAGVESACSSGIIKSYDAPFRCDGALDALRGATGLDYLEERENADVNGQPDAGPPKEKRTKRASGTACATAVDKDACRTKVEAAYARGTLFHTCRGMCPAEEIYWVTTRGDDVRVVVSRDDLRQLVLPVTAPSKAWALATHANYQVDCKDSGWVRSIAEGYELKTTVGVDDCPITYASVRLLVREDGTLEEMSREEQPSDGACAGRRPQGLRIAAVETPSCASGAYFARCAALEAASVHAFRRLARELRKWGAPRDLCKAALRGAEDEVRHTQVMTRLANRYGASPATIRVPRLGSRSLFEMARENLVEGCIRETYGALEALWQARHAADPEVRRTLRAIAEDETRHAALSWGVHAWVSKRLTDEERAELRRAALSAVSDLERELSTRHDASLATIAGLPLRDAARPLVRALKDQLWGTPEPVAA